MTRTNKILVKVPKSVKNAIYSIIDIPKSDARKVSLAFNKLSMEYVKNSTNFFPDLNEVEKVLKSKEKYERVTLNYDDPDYKKFFELANIECRSINKQAFWVLICISLKLKKENIKHIKLNQVKEVELIK